MATMRMTRKTVWYRADYGRDAWFVILDETSKTLEYETNYSLLMEDGTEEKLEDIVYFEGGKDLLRRIGYIYVGEF